jgi:N-acetylglutamate synthase-like GNAT family acetyltransferase
MREQVKIHTLSTSRAIRKQIISMIEHIQKNEFLLPIPDNINACILRAEDEFYYNNSYNFWYAVDTNGVVIGSMGLKKIDEHQGEIKKFFVDSTYRGKGVAQKLMTTLLKAASKHRFDFLYLGTVDALQAAQSFYKKYGFSQITKQQLPAGFELCPIDTLFFKIKFEDLQHKLLEISN